MRVASLITPPPLTRELSEELSGVGIFIRLEVEKLKSSAFLTEELDEFERSGSKLKLSSFPMLYNDFERLLLDNLGVADLARCRRKFRLKFPYLSALDQMIVFFLPADRQSCAIVCLFLSEVLTRIMDIHGQSKVLKERFQQVVGCFAVCRTSREALRNTTAHIEVLDMPRALFGVLSPSLGKQPVLNLYQRTYDKLQSQYSSLPTFVFLQNTMEKIFSAP